VLSLGDRFARYRSIRFRRLAEVSAMREEVIALKDLKYGKHNGQNTAVEIAGGVRQLDIFHAPVVGKQDPLLLGRMGELAYRIAEPCGITHATHKISSVKLLVTPALEEGQADAAAVGEQLVHWDFPTAYLTQGKYTMLWHLSEAAGQRTTALPRFEAHHQPDERTTNEQLRDFLQPLFDKKNYASEAARIGDVTLFDQCIPHFGTANTSSQERIVVFFMFLPSGTHARTTHISGPLPRQTVSRCSCADLTDWVWLCLCLCACVCVLVRRVERRPRSAHRHRRRSQQ